MSSLQTLYKSILATCWLAPDKDGKILLDLAFDKSEKTPFLVEGRQLVMPTDAQLKAYHPDKVVVFHPLQEFINRGESEVVKALRHQLNARINYSILAISTALFQLVSSSAEHRNLSPEQRELLLKVNDTDMAASGRYAEFVTRGFSKKPQSYFTSIYLKKAGTFHGEKHARVGVVSFPFYEEFNLSDKELKLKKTDAENYKNMLEFMFPGSIDDAEAYNAYSDNTDAPWLDCLLKTSYNLAARLNELLDLYGDYIDNAKEYQFNLDWIDAIDNIDAYRTEIRRIPIQKGNEGTADVKPPETASAEMASRTLPAPRGQEQHRQQPEVPSYQRQPVPVVQQPPQVVQQQVVYVDQYGRPIPPPQQYQQAPVQAPGLVYNESGKVDFRSISASVPAVAAAAMVSTPITEWQNAQLARANPAYGYPQAPVNPGYGPAVAPVAVARYTGAAPGQAYDPRYQQQQRYPQAGYPSRGPLISNI